MLHSVGGNSSNISGYKTKQTSKIQNELEYFTAGVSGKHIFKKNGNRSRTSMIFSSSSSGSKSVATHRFFPKKKTQP